MINIEEVKAKALECGFTTVAEMDVDTIELNPAARDACAENKCRSYGKNWSCPPGCGTLDECSEMIHKYKRGLILQTTGEVDTMDFEEIMELGYRGLLCKKSVKRRSEARHTADRRTNRSHRRRHYDDQYDDRP